MSSTTFGPSRTGITITDFGLTAAGQILVAGHTLGRGVNTDFALAHYHADGGLDQSFGTGGIVKTDIGDGDGDDFART